MARHICTPEEFIARIATVEKVWKSEFASVKAKRNFFPTQAVASLEMSGRGHSDCG